MLNKIILYSSAFVVLLPLVVAIAKYRYFSNSFKILTLHLLVVSLFSAVSGALYFFKKNNLPLLHLYTVVELITITWFYSSIHAKWPKIFLLLLLLAFIILAMVDGCYIEGWFQFNTLPRSIECLVVISYSISVYFKILTEMNIEKLQYSPLFWVNTGFLFYFSGALFLFALSEYLLPLKLEYRMYVWTFHALLSSLLYFFIFTGLCYYKKTSI